MIGLRQLRQRNIAVRLPLQQLNQIIILQHPQLLGLLIVHIIALADRLQHTAADKGVLIQIRPAARHRITGKHAHQLPDRIIIFAGKISDHRSPDHKAQQQPEQVQVTDGADALPEHFCRKHTDILPARCIGRFNGNHRLCILKRARKGPCPAVIPLPVKRRSNCIPAGILDQHLIIGIHNEHLAAFHPVDIAQYGHDFLSVKRNNQRPCRLRASLLRQ
ncbi:hypothetical protein D3C75_412970 [compost metagenome]